MSIINLAETCSVCKHAMFKRPQDWYYWGRGKKQLGICTGLCDGEVPKVAPKRVPHGGLELLGDDRFPERRTMRDYAVVGVLFFREDFIHACRVAASDNWQRTLRNLIAYWRNAGEERDKEVQGYTDRGLSVEYVIDPDSKYSRRQYRKTVTYYQTRGQYIQQRRKMVRDHLKTLPYTDKNAATWERYYDTFMENYWWWQENWPKARRCHRNTTCDLFEMENRREPVARSITKGGYALHKEE